MSNVPADSLPRTSWTVRLIDSHTPAESSTDHTSATATTVTTPKAIESKNAVFITDHGSTCVSRSLALRLPLGRGGRFVGALGFDAVSFSGLFGRDGVPLTVAEPSVRELSSDRVPRELPDTAAATRSDTGRLAVPDEASSSDLVRSLSGRRGASGVSSGRRSAIRTPRSQSEHHHSRLLHRRPAPRR